MTALITSLTALHRQRYDGETCSGCATCYKAGHYLSGGYVPDPDCRECCGTGCSSAHVQELIEELCEHGTLVTEVCEPCWSEAQDVARGIFDDEVRAINAGGASC